jgi:hypothetical protein
VRQNLYICCRCGEELRTSVDCDDAPPDWAVVTYQRDSVALTTHACGVCCAEVVDFLKKAIRPGIDSAFDDGGVA